MQAKILHNKQILPLYYKLGISLEDFPSIKPGQFIMLRINEQIDPLLRRPFGIYKILKQRASSALGGLGGGKGQDIEILYKVVGKGTRLMTNLKPGNAVDLLGPLGNGFTLEFMSQTPKVGKQKILMVAGGIGIAPFYLLAKNYKLSAVNFKLLFGGRGKDDLPGLEDFRKLDIRMDISTEDGSIGRRGLITDLMRKELSKKGDYIVYACGPKGMLKRVAATAEKADIPCYVSLDNAMACGMGACLGCAVKVRSQKSEVRSQNKKYSKLQTPNYKLTYKMVCKHGPVFDAKEIAWQEI